MGMARKIRKVKENQKRVTIFTVNMNNNITIIKDLTTLASYGKEAFIGLGSFDGPLQMAEIAKKNNFIIDEGAIIDKSSAPKIYEEMKNGTARESSPGSMELAQVIEMRIQQDWGYIIRQADNANELYHHLMDLYFASTCLHIANNIKKN